MTTNKQLQEWLKRFPDDCIINVVTTEDASGSYYNDVSVCTKPVQLPDVVMPDLTWKEYEFVDFDIVYDTDEGECVGVKSITLGKNFRG